MTARADIFSPSAGVLLCAAVADVVDAVIDLAEYLHLDAAVASLAAADRWTLTHGADSTAWGLGAVVETPHLDDPGAYPPLALRAWLGPLWLEAEYAAPQLTLERACVAAKPGVAS